MNLLNQSIIPHLNNENIHYVTHNGNLQIETTSQTCGITVKNNTDSVIIQMVAFTDDGPKTVSENELEGPRTAHIIANLARKL